MTLSLSLFKAKLQRKNSKTLEKTTFWELETFLRLFHQKVYFISATEQAFGFLINFNFCIAVLKDGYGYFYQGNEKQTRATLKGHYCLYYLKMSHFIKRTV